jgi:hypothetical protein
MYRYDPSASTTHRWDFVIGHTNNLAGWAWDSAVGSPFPGDC